MTHSENHIDFESKCRQIIGCTVQKVQYAEIDYYPDSPQPCYKTAYPEIDSIDFSVSLFTSGNNEIEIFWDDDFYPYGVGIRIDEKSAFNGNRKWDVSHEQMWEDCIGQRIIEVIIYWDETWINSSITGYKNYYTYPLGLGLFFSHGEKIIIGAAEFKNKDFETAHSGMDNLLVTSNEELALKTQMIFVEGRDEKENRTFWKRLF